MMNEALTTDIRNSVLCWLATVDENGDPSVTPKEIFAAYADDRIVVADIASSNSVRNIRHNPSVCVSFVDVFRQRGFKIIGRAIIIGRESEDFAVLGADLLKMAGESFPIRHVIAIQIERVSRIWAPSYRIFPHLTDEERMQQACRTYGVTPTES